MRGRACNRRNAHEGSAVPGRRHHRGPPSSVATCWATRNRRNVRVKRGEGVTTRSFSSGPIAAGRPIDTAGRFTGVDALPPDVAAWIVAYRPRLARRNLWEEALADFVVPAVIELAPTTRPTAETYLWSITRLCLWALEQGLPLDREVVFDPDLVERYSRLGDLGRSRNTIRSVLRRVGPHLTRKAPWLPAPARIRYRTSAVPYSDKDVEALRIDADRQSSPSRRRAAQALLLLGLGIGADGRWAVRVRGSDVTTATGAVLVALGPPAPRTVPVLAQYEEELLALARAAGDEALVGGRSAGKNKASRMIARYERGPGRPSLSAPRLRATWLLWHLRAGTRLPELAQAAGFARISSLDELVRLVEPLPPSLVVRELRGS